MHASFASKDIFSFLDHLQFLYLQVTHLVDGHPRWRTRDDQVSDEFHAGSAGQNEAVAHSVGMK